MNSGTTLMRKALRKLMGSFRGRRDPRLLLLAKLPKAAVCAEIGVWRGDFSALIQSKTLPKKLHLIDPWEFQSEFPERWYGGVVSKNQADMERVFEDVTNRFKEHQNISVERGKSQEVLRHFADGYFDWVYIDGNHSYDYVLNDLKMCLLKVKPEGIIAGDDYTWGEKEGFPVRRAVGDFLEENNLQKKLELIDSQFIIKL